MKEMSGSRVLERGVGTQMEMASHSVRRSMSVVASRQPGLYLLPDVIIGKVLNVGEPLVDPLCHPFLDIETQDLDSAPGRFNGKGKTYVPQANDAEDQIISSETLNQVLGHRECSRQR